jgi:hypothetical protein
LSIGRLPIPPRAYTKLHWWSQKSLVNGAAVFANYRLEPTYAYDIDPVLGSTAMPFFSEMATLYRFYRVIESRITVRFANQADAIVFNACVCPTNSDPGANTASYSTYQSNPLARKGIIGTYNGDSTCTVTNSARTDMFAGAKWEGVADAYCARTDGTGGAPTNNWFWYVGVAAEPAMVGGVWSFVDLDLDICFFEETSPSS